VIYNAKPVLLNGINGPRQAVAVVARSNLFNGGQDVSDFRSAFGISGGFVSTILNGPDPGDLGGGEEQRQRWMPRGRPLWRRPRVWIL